MRHRLQAPTPIYDALVRELDTTDRGQLSGDLEPEGLSLPIQPRESTTQEALRRALAKISPEPLSSWFRPAVGE